ncbi:MAG: hypothetical protein GWN67_12565, partial [Phycisphaerae bacterium]|nr:hypothetical protein [Phycisphaerae bacterium]
MRCRIAWGAIWWPPSAKSRIIPIPEISFRIRFTLRWTSAPGTTTMPLKPGSWSVKTLKKL